MLKKAFTLAELVIVVIVIWILFWALWYLSWDYVYKLNIQNDKEIITSTFFYIQTTSLSQPVYKGKPLSYIWLAFAPEKKYFKIVWLTWDFSSKVYTLWVKNLSYLKFWTWFEVNGHFYNSWMFLYKPYKIWSFFVVSDINGTKVFSGNQDVKFIFYDRIKACFKINLLSWRLKEISCN